MGTRILKKEVKFAKINRQKFICTIYANNPQHWQSTIWKTRLKKKEKILWGQEYWKKKKIILISLKLYISVLAVSKMFVPPSPVWENVCPPGDKQIVCPPGDKQNVTHWLTNEALYIYR